MKQPDNQLSAIPKGGTTIEHWNPEDETFWRTVGHRVAQRNLWISIPALLAAFAIWSMWGVITVQMINLGFPFTQAQLFTITAIAGLSGATLRIPASFFVRLSGGRNTIFLTTVLLMVPAIGAGIALQSKETPLWVFQLLALLSGIGGGNFACSMGNITGFYPKHLQGTALGLNAGLGNFGVTAAQLLIPILMTIGLFSVIGGEPMTLVKDSGSAFGKIAAGTHTWIQNAGFLWLLLLVPLVFFCWFGMNNLRVASPGVTSTLKAFVPILLLYGVGLVVSVVGLWLYLPEPTGLGVLNMWIAMPLIIVATLLAMKAVATSEMKSSLSKQFEIFKNKHTWAMTALYMVTFGSFIGFSMAVPLAITVIFGFQHVPDASGVMTHTTLNPNAPSALTWAWIGPFLGAATRPLGGWISDKLGGSIVTQVVSVLMMIFAIIAGYVMLLAYQSATPEQYFACFMALFLVLFAVSGIGNGSTFRSIGVIFSRDQTGPALGWTSAVAAYGAFIAPVVIGDQIRAGSPEYAMYGFAVFYALCLIINWWFYLRKNAYVKNP